MDYLSLLITNSQGGYRNEGEKRLIYGYCKCWLIEEKESKSEDYTPPFYIKARGQDNLYFVSGKNTTAQSASNPLPEYNPDNAGFYDRRHKPLISFFSR